MNSEVDNPYASLVKGFHVGFDAAFLKRDKLNQVWEVILRCRNGKYVSLKSRMLDIEERKEEGQLSVSPINSIDLDSYIEVYFPRFLGVDSELYFLLSPDPRNTVPSGVRIVESNGVRHDIVAGAAPESLVFLSPFYRERKLPEYPIDLYSVLPYEDFIGS